MSEKVIAGYNLPLLRNLTNTDANERFSKNKLKNIVKTHIVTDLEKLIIQCFKIKNYSLDGQCIVFTGTHACGKTETLNSITLSLTRSDSTIIPVFLSSTSLSKYEMIVQIIDQTENWLEKTNRLKNIKSSLSIIKKNLEKNHVPLELINQIKHLPENEFDIELALQGYNIDKPKLMKQLTDLITTNEWKLLILVDDRVVSDHLLWLVRDIGIPTKMNFVIFLNHDKWFTTDSDHIKQMTFEFEDQVKRRHENIPGKLIFDLPGKIGGIKLKETIHVPDLNSYLSIKVSLLFKSMFAICGTKDRLKFPIQTLELFDRLPVNTFLLGNKVRAIRGAILSTLDWYERLKSIRKIEYLEFKINFGHFIFHQIITESNYMAFGNMLKQHENLTEEQLSIVKALMVSSISVSELTKGDIVLLEREKIISEDKLENIYHITPGSELDVISPETENLGNSYDKYYNLAMEQLKNKDGSINTSLDSAISWILSDGIRAHENISLTSPFSLSNSGNTILNDLIRKFKPSSAQKSVITIEDGLLSDYQFKIRFTFIDNSRKGYDIKSELLELFNNYKESLALGPDLEIILTSKKIDIDTILKGEEIYLNSILKNKEQIKPSDCIKQLVMKDYDLSLVDFVFISLFVSNIEDDALLIQLDNQYTRFQLRKSVNMMYRDINRIIYDSFINLISKLQLPRIDRVKDFQKLIKNHGPRMLLKAKISKSKGFDEEIIDDLISAKLLHEFSLKNDKVTQDVIYPTSNPFGIENIQSFITWSPIEKKAAKSDKGILKEQHMRKFLPIPQTFMFELFHKDLIDLFGKGSKEDISSNLRIELQNRKNELDYLIKFGLAITNSKKSVLNVLNSVPLDTVEGKKIELSSNLRPDEIVKANSSLKFYELIIDHISQGMKYLPNKVLQSLIEIIKGDYESEWEENKEYFAKIKKLRIFGENYLHGLKEKINQKTRLIETSGNSLDKSYKKILQIQTELQEEQTT